jgi:hypothetical protein
MCTGSRTVERNETRLILLGQTSCSTVATVNNYGTGTSCITDTWK